MYESLQVLSCLNQKRSSFRYATGAAFCISSTLMPQMERYIRWEQ